MSAGFRTILRFGDPATGRAEAKTHGQASTPGVCLWGDGEEGRRFDVQIPLDEFMELVKYVMVNTDLSCAEWEGKEDPRVEFLEWVAQLDVVRGWSKGHRRLRKKGGYDAC